jgi:translation initiation factor IF-2
MAVRPPVVAILGHVDHGKTTLLDYIRKSHVADKEHGGITQKIGAYEITVPIKGYPTNKITFIDTPGHEAFSKLRARGATVADIAILLIDAKDSLKPQTVESISHIKSAKIPFIIALNKTDLPDANPEKVKIDLLKHDVQTEDKGGTVPTVKVSGKTGLGVDELLESILLIASEMNLQYDPAGTPSAYIIETKKDKRGLVVSAIIKEGALSVGDAVFTEGKKAKIRSLVSDLGKPLQKVEPSMPFELLGFNELPEVGSRITAVEQAAQATKEVQKTAAFDMKTLMAPEVEEEKKLALIIKADSQGSLEAILYSLAKNNKITIILSAVGDVYRSDVFLAKTTKAVIIGFSVNADNEVKELAKQEKIVIKTYNIIYELIDDLNEVADLLREKETQERSLKGEARIVATFIIEGETIYGVKVTKGKINLGDGLEVHRGDNQFGKTKLVSLKQRAKPVNEVKKDQDAGMVFSPPLDIKEGDMVKSIL